jgi:DNA uptake protein ComE-like DNA-binding protein
MTSIYPVAAALALLAQLASGPAAAYGTTLAGATPPAVASKTQGTPGPSVVRLVDLNSASRSDLKTLPGIDDAAADRIVAARPYPSKAKLVADKVISMELFLSLKDRVVAVQQPPLRAKASPHSSRQP